MRTVFRAMKCPCGHKACTSWFVDPVAAVQCVRFTKEQAEAVAEFMNRPEQTWNQEPQQE